MMLPHMGANPARRFMCVECCHTALTMFDSHLAWSGKHSVSIALHVVSDRALISPQRARSVH